MNCLKLFLLWTTQCKINTLGNFFNETIARITNSSLVGFSNTDWNYFIVQNVQNLLFHLISPKNLLLQINMGE